MSKAKERVVSVEQRIAALLNVLGDPALSSTPDSDCEALVLLLQAGELIAVADDLLESQSEIGELLADASIALPEAAACQNEVRVSLLGIGLGLDTCSLIALPPAHIDNHRGGCISPDPAEAIAGQDKPKSTTQNPDNSASSTSPTVDAKSNDTTDGDSPQAQPLVQLASATPTEALEELSNQLLDRADRLIDKAQSIKSQTPVTNSTPA